MRTFRQAHNEMIIRITHIPSLNRFVTASRDGVLCLWEINGTQVRSLSIFASCLSFPFSLLRSFFVIHLSYPFSYLCISVLFFLLLPSSLVWGTHPHTLLLQLRFLFTFKTGCKLVTDIAYLPSSNRLAVSSVKHSISFYEFSTVSNTARLAAYIPSHRFDSSSPVVMHVCRESDTGAEVSFRLSFSIVTFRLS